MDPSNEYPHITYNITSDKFFEEIFPTLKYKYDIIFIDGLHETEQVDKDVENALKSLNPNGTIVMHDCNPITREMQQVPRIQGEWTGDVWKSILKLRFNSFVNVCVVDTDYGCGIVRKNKQAEHLSTYLPESNVDVFSYDYLERKRKEILNLISIEKFKEKYGKDSSIH